MTESRIIQILEELRLDIDPREEKHMIDEGVLDSFDIVSLVQDLNDEFDIDIDVDELVPDNFNTLEAMVELVDGKLE